MDEDGKSADYSAIWDSANQARDIHLALMFALATTAFADGWEALRPHIRSGKPGVRSGRADRKQADAA
jgi:hypothetical protein